MINCYFDDESYYILGKDIEVFSTIKNEETDPIRRAYWMFLVLLPELSLEKDNVTFYNDSRLIDEMNGTVNPLDDWAREAKRISNQMLTSLYGIALFRKLDSNRLEKMVAVGREKMIDPRARQTVLASLEEKWNKQHSSRVKKLRDNFFGAKHD